MSFFYDPQKRQANPAAFVIFIGIPIILIILLIVLSQGTVEKHKTKKQQEEAVDILDKF